MRHIYENFCDTGLMEQSAHFGWQNKDSALYGLREGYKNSADDLVNIAISNGADIKTLDTYIFQYCFPIGMHLSCL